MPDFWCRRMREATTLLLGAPGRQVPIVLVGFTATSTACMRTLHGRAVAAMATADPGTARVGECAGATTGAAGCRLPAIGPALGLGLTGLGTGTMQRPARELRGTA